MLRTTLGLKLHCSIFAWPICHELRPNLLESILFNPRLSQWRQYVGAQWSVCEGKRFWIECWDIAMLPCISHSFPKMSKEASVLQHKAAPCTIFAAGTHQADNCGTACISRLSQAQKRALKQPPTRVVCELDSCRRWCALLRPLNIIGHERVMCPPMDAQTLSQSLIFLELTLQFLKGQQLRHGSEAGPIPVFWLAFLPFGFLGFVRILPFCLALLLACAMCVWILSWHSWLLLGLCPSPFQSTATESATQHGQRW